MCISMVTVYGAEQKVLYTHRNFVFDVGVGGWVWVGVGGCVGVCGSEV
jgi:hypothetical protein